MFYALTGAAPHRAPKMALQFLENNFRNNLQSSQRRCIIYILIVLFCQNTRDSPEHSMMEVVLMKRLLALLLALTLVLSLGVAAFADEKSEGADAAKTGVRSPTGGDGGAVSDLGWGEFTTPKAPVEEGMEIYNAAGEKIGIVPAEEVIQLAIGEADKLSPEDKEAFLKAYDEVKTIEDEVVMYFYWLDVPEKYKTDDAAWFKYSFKAPGINVRALINGKPLDVVHVKGVEYYAKLTELGALTVLVGLNKTQDKNGNGLELYNAEDKCYDTVPMEDVIEVPAENPDALGADVQDAFLAAYEEARAAGNLDRFFWLDVPDSYKTDEFVWAKYGFTCAGGNVAVTLNGEPVEVVNVDGDSYYARLTGFGAVAISCDASGTPADSL